ncbi:MAG TPA: permease [Candidatus Omnitrophota bacterium]|nr:permease [Candidatus Omnitrophota bacterium]HPS36257.1 permease [Candidatus Omnitrophota bacterium]
MLQLAVDRWVYGILRLPPGTKWAEAVDFFIYDSIKILVLLFVMIAAIGILRSYLPQEKIKGWIGEKKNWGNFFASLFGAVTPFCSCSSIPLFLSFLKAGIPLGITFSFLITSPLINEYLVVLMLGFFGWKITLAYILSGMAIGIVCGIMLGKMNLEIHLVEDLLPGNSEAAQGLPLRGFKDRVVFGVREASSILKKLWLWVLAGVGIGALIHNYVPAQTIQGIIAKTGFLSVPIATIIGVPMYGSCATIVPIAVVLFQKGVPLGTALSFMMAVSALSLPEAIMLRRAMKLPLIAIFFGITTLGIIFTGYLINFLQPVLVR